MPLPADDTLVLLHNPRCSKSRATLALLEERGAKFEIREYLSDPLSREELAGLGGCLGRPPREWVRSKEAAFSDAVFRASLSASHSPRTTKEPQLWPIK